MPKSEYVEIMDIDGTKRIRNNSNLFYEEDGQKYSKRVDLKESFGNDINEFMLCGYVPSSYDMYTEEELKKMKENDYEGKFVFKLLLNDDSIALHYFSFIGFETEDTFRLVPVKVPKDNYFTIDPIKIKDAFWYYIDDIEEDEYI